MKKAIIYCRLSTQRQFEHKDTLTTQENTCRKQAEKLKANVIRVFTEIAKGDAVNREKLLELEAYLYHHSSEIKYVIIAFGKRFARSVEIATGIVDLLRKYDIELIDCKFPNLRGEESYANFLKLAAEGKVEKLKLSKSTKQAIQERKSVGKSWGRPPAGYSFKHDVNGSNLFSEDLFRQNIKRMFILASQGFQIKKIRSQLKAEGYGDIPNSTISYRLRNKVYVGYVKDSTRKILCKGAHEAIIDERIFNDVQKLLTNEIKRKKRRKKTQSDENLPLRNWLLCKGCGGPFTGSRIYYRCNKCKISKKNMDLHEQLIQLLNTFDYESDSAEDFIVGYLDYPYSFIKELLMMRDKLQSKNELIESRIETLDKQYLKAENPALDDIYKKERGKYVVLKEDNINKINQIPYLFPLIDDILDESHAVKSFGEIWKKEDYDGKKVLLNDIFPKGLYYDGAKLELIEINPDFRQIKLNEKTNIERINEQLLRMRSKLRCHSQQDLSGQENKEVLDELFNEIRFRLQKKTQSL